MKNILFLLALVCFVLTSCQKEEEFDEIAIEVTEQPPQEINPEVSFRAIDRNGNPLSDVKLQVFEEGTQALEVFTDNTGMVTTEIPSQTLEKRLLLLGEKEVYKDHVVRIEPEQIESGLVEIVLSPVETSASIIESNASTLVTSDVVLLNGQVTDASGNRGGFAVYIYELDAILNGDTTLFADYVLLDNPQGTYEMLVPANVDLVLSIFEFDPCSADQFRTINAEDIALPDGYFGENIGSFTEDTTLPTNTNAGEITGQPVDLTFNGKVIGCGDLPVANSFVSFYTIDFTGGSLLGSTTTDSEGIFSKTLNIGCVGYPGFVAIVNSPNTPQFSYSTNYVEGEDSVDFGELASCGQSIFTIGNHTNTGDITSNNLIVADYEEEVSIRITASANATDQFLLAGDKMNNGFWSMSEFEYYENGELLYRLNSQDMIFSVIDDVDRIRMNILGIEVDILSGPDAGTMGGLFSGTATIFK